jgi:hypothetical protein
MTLPVWVPGYLGAITINAEDFTVVGNVINFERSKASLPKPVFGSQYRRTASGQINGTVTLDGHVAPEKLPALETAFALETPVAFTIQMGTDAAATDAGDYAGNAIFTALSITGEAEGEWEFSATLETDGAVAYTAPTP